MIAIELAVETEARLDGGIEVDERDFRGSRTGQRGRSAVGKIPVFGLLKRAGKGYIKGGLYKKYPGSASSPILVPIIERKVVPDSMMVYSDGWQGYKALDVAGFPHACINHSKRFADGHNHMNGIGNVWNQAKRHMCHFDGVLSAQFRLYLKACEWRFNRSNSISLKTIVKRYLKVVRWVSPN